MHKQYSNCRLLLYFIIHTSYGVVILLSAIISPRIWCVDFVIILWLLLLLLWLLNSYTSYMCAVTRAPLHQIEMAPCFLLMMLAIMYVRYNFKCMLSQVTSQSSLLWYSVFLCMSCCFSSSVCYALPCIISYAFHLVPESKASFAVHYCAQNRISIQFGWMRLADRCMVEKKIVYTQSPTINHEKEIEISQAKQE